MQNDRSAVITVGGEEYELLLTTRATKEIAAKCGGIENLGERLTKNENLEEALDLVIWLITVLANQSIMIYNHNNRDAQKPLLTSEEIELLTAPYELVGYKDAIMEAVQKGTARYVHSEDDGKNTQAG